MEHPVPEIDLRSDQAIRISWILSRCTKSAPLPGIPGNMIQMYPRDRARCLLCAVGIASLIPHSPEPQRAHLRPVTITRIRPLLALSHIGAYCPVLQDTFRHG